MRHVYQLSAFESLGIGKNEHEEGKGGWKAHHSRPSLIRPTLGILLPHHVGALFIPIHTPITIGLAWRHHRHAVERVMLVQAVHYFLPGCRSQGFGVTRRHGFKRRMLGIEVPGQQHGVVGTFVVVGRAGNVVQAVDAVGADVVLATKVRGAAGAQFVVAEHVQRAMALVPRVPCG